MAMGTRKQQERQEEFWVATAALPRSAGHPFYERLNELLEEAGFDAFVEGRCRRYYAEAGATEPGAGGVLSAAADRVFRYFEGLDGERGIAWRAADSLGLRRFLRIGLDEAPPDHSTYQRNSRPSKNRAQSPVFKQRKDANFRTLKPIEIPAIPNHASLYHASRDHLLPQDVLSAEHSPFDWLPGKGIIEILCITRIKKPQQQVPES